jgi:hypothetical protein
MRVALIKDGRIDIVAEVEESRLVELRDRWLLRYDAVEPVAEEEIGGVAPGARFDGTLPRGRRFERDLEAERAAEPRRATLVEGIVHRTVVIDESEAERILSTRSKTFPMYFRLAGGARQAAMIEDEEELEELRSAARSGRSGRP